MAPRRAAMWPGAGLWYRRRMTSHRKGAVIVHGGAGDFADERAPGVRAGCLRAVDAGLAALSAGAGALNAAQAAVRALEDDPEFNAGVGAVLTRDGTVEADAALMDGRDLRFGGIAAVENARQPIDLARAILDDGEHALLCGEGAWAFLRAQGFRACAPDVLITERARARLEAAAERAGRTVAERDPERDRDPEPGTVGACVIDETGRVAAATSTGGMTYKRRGRIGDTPICGGGTFADDAAGAASATGEGEAILRVTMSRFCADAMRGGMSAQGAAREAVRELGDRVGGRGGIICVDRNGRVGAAHNSRRMAYGAGLLGDRDLILGRDAGVALVADEDLDGRLVGD